MLTSGFKNSQWIQEIAHNLANLPGFDEIKNPQLQVGWDARTCVKSQWSKMAVGGGSVQKL